MYRELTKLREHRWRRTLTQDELEKLAGDQPADDCSARARLPKSTSPDCGQADQSPEG